MSTAFSLILVHCFLGGESNPQAEAFAACKTRLLREYGPIFKFVELTVKQVKDLMWSETDLANWLFSSHIHLIVCHPHQGCSTAWSPAFLEQELQQLLYDHIGFPTGEQLGCPIFMQNKIRYLHAIHAHTNATLDITIRSDGDYSRDIANIRSFTARHNETDVWVLKKPYVTNAIMTQCSSVDEIVVALETETSNSEYGHIYYPYIMLQTKMKNNYEYKVVCWNMEAMYIAITKRGYGFAFAKSREEKVALLRFASEAVQLLKAKCPSAIVDGLVRVDIFQTSTGRLVVNEFESLEARYSDTRGQQECVITSRLGEYWYNVMVKCIADYNRRLRGNSRT